MKYALFLSLIFNLLLLANGQASKHLNLDNGIALKGYDAVSYFSGKPEEGKKSISAVFRGATYYFNDAENRDTFLANPSKYAPAYGGWCAYAMGETGDKVRVDPETYKILDGRLYLFYNFRGNNTLKSWNRDEETLRPRADRYWKALQDN